MKKIFRLLLLCTILAISVVPVSAQAEYLLPNNLPENIIQEIRESYDEVKVIDEAKFILGDTIYRYF